MILVEPDQRWRLRSKVCTGCGERKLWPGFTAQAYWPDGSVRYVMSACKVCRAASGRTEKVRLQKRAQAERAREGLRAEVLAQKHGPRLPVRPFRAWLRAERKRAPLSMIADRTGVSERSLLRVLEENCHVELELADRVLLETPIRLEDLWTEEELRAAA